MFLHQSYVGQSPDPTNRTALASMLLIEPLQPRACADAERCIGILRTREQAFHGCPPDMLKALFAEAALPIVSSSANTILNIVMGWLA